VGVGAGAGDSGAGGVSTGVGVAGGGVGASGFIRDFLLLNGLAYIDLTTMQHLLQALASTL
jgi:hypothetical protein